MERKMVLWTGITESRRHLIHSIVCIGVCNFAISWRVSIKQRLIRMTLSCRCHPVMDKRPMRFWMHHLSILLRYKTRNRRMMHQYFTREGQRESYVFGKDDVSKQSPVGLWATTAGDWTQWSKSSFLPPFFQPWIHRKVMNTNEEA